MDYRAGLGLLVSFGITMSVSAGAHAAFIQTGVYQLHNHPDGTAIPPPYGMRLDELFDVTVGGHDIFTFDFDDPASDMKLSYDGATIRIFGVSFGGRDIGGAYAAEPTTGLYTIDFLYTVGVSPVPGDDDIWVQGADGSNFGTILPPVGPAINLTDKTDGSHLFRFGDEDDDLGHRGFPGISGWGWLTHHPESMDHVPASDWIFTAELIPTPGAAAVMGVFGLCALRRRR